MLVLVCASRASQQAFPVQTLLGASLARLGEFMPFALRLFPNNSRALGACYNEALDAAAADDVLAFIHDDVRIDDWMLGQRLMDALSHFDVAGVAGNRRRQAGQFAWYLQPPVVADKGQLHAPWDSDHLSGAIVHTGGAHSQAGTDSVSVYGPSPAEVALLDGVLIAARVRTLRDSNLRFDASLGFHFYDLDFCRAARAAHLRLGTWPIALSHASNGASIQSTAWERSRALYFQKWQS